VQHHSPALVSRSVDGPLSDRPDPTRNGRAARRPTRVRASTVFLMAGAIASVLASSSCAGRRAARLRAKEAEAAAAASAANDSLDLAALSAKRASGKGAPADAVAPSSLGSVHDVLSQQDLSSTSSTGSSAARIYDEPVLDLTNQPDPTVNIPPSAAYPHAAENLPVAVGAADGAVPAPASESADQVWSAALPASSNTSGAPMRVVPASPLGLESGSDFGARSREQLIAELVRNLTAETSGSGPAGSEILHLLAIDLVQPGSAQAELDRAAAALTPAEAQAFQTVRELFRSLADGPGRTGAATDQVWDGPRLRTMMSDAAARLETFDTLGVSKAVLCTSVDGFGRYTPYPSTTFEQGRAHAAILYLAMDHVSQSKVASTGVPAPSPTPPEKQSTLDRVRSAVASALDVKPDASRADESVDWEIDISQSARLYHDADDLMVWNFGDQDVRDAARDRRNDFCIARRIELPAKLSLGRYNLKITVRDKNSGASAEAVIPIQIVADAALTSK